MLKTSVFIKLSVSFFLIFSSRVLGIPQTDPPVVFVSRNLVHNGNLFYPQSGLLPGMGPFSRFAVVGGELLVREGDGSIRVLVDSKMNFNGITLIDVSDPCVFWDGSRILFAGIEHRDSSWRIYEINADGSGFRNITFSDRNIDLSQFGGAAHKFERYDDIDPCYLPDGRVCFASTRYPSLSQFGTRTTNLYIINSNGTDIHRITTEKNGAEEPSIDPNTGKIVFSRWWLNIDMPSRVNGQSITRDINSAISNDIGNVWWCARMNPDGTGLELYAGSTKSRNGLQAYKPAVMNDGKLLSVFVPQTSMVNTSGSSGIRWFQKDIGNQHHIIGVNADDMELYISEPPSYGTMKPPFATDPVELPDGRILFSFANEVENQDYALYTCNPDGSNLQKFFDIAGKLELNADVLLPKPVPPIISEVVGYISEELPPTDDPETYFKNGSFRFDCGNVFTNAGVDEPIIDAPPISKNARIRLFLNFQRTDTSGRDMPILFIDEPVQFSGGFWIPSVPADIPVFDQLVDSNGRVISGGLGQIAHLTGLAFGRPGTGTKCAGCHAGHSKIPPPMNNYLAGFFNTSTSATVTESSFRRLDDSNQYPGKRVVDRKTSNDLLTVNWIAEGTNNEYVKLKWEVPIDVQSFVIYNIKPNESNKTNIQVSDCEIFLYYQSGLVKHISSTGMISVNGTKVIISGIPKIDEAKIVVKSFTGLITGQSAAGLAEVETIARISFYEVTRK